MFLLKNLLLSNTPLKIICIFLGYSFWYIASFNQLINYSIRIPLCFTSSLNNHIIKAPEFIDITLEGKRSSLYALDKKALNAHVDIEKFSIGTHNILLNDKNLFLPKEIRLVHYKPLNLTFTIISNNEKEIL